MDKAGSNSGMRDSTGRQPMPKFEQPHAAAPTIPAAADKNRIVQSPAQKPAPQRASPPSAQSNPGLSQSFDQRSIAVTQNQQKNIESPPPPADPGASPNALRTSVDAAINNVDRALSEMHKQEVDRLKARIDAMDRERATVDEELRKERIARKQQDDKIRDLETRRSPAASPSSSGYGAGGASPDKRKMDLLEKQVQQLKQDKQREEMRRLEAESTLKSVERRANDLQYQVRVVCVYVLQGGVEDVFLTCVLVGASLTHTHTHADGTDVSSR
jgi:hypothetical protein